MGVWFERINLASNTAVIGGLLYYMAPGVEVEINDSYGAFSMLKKGMFVRVYYVEPRDNDRRAVYIEHLTNPADWEETLSPTRSVSRLPDRHDCFPVSRRRLRPVPSGPCRRR